MGLFLAFKLNYLVIFLDCHFCLRTQFPSPDAFANDIMSDAPASDVAVKFADYVLENYIDVDSKFPPTLCAQVPDVSGAIPHTNNGAEAYHSQ